MVAPVAEAEVTVLRLRSRRVRWLAAAIVAALAVVYLAAVTSTHAALSGGPVGWTAPGPADLSGLTEPTAAEYAMVFPASQGYGQVLWATRPGGELAFGFGIHNGGPVPVTLLGVALRGYPPYEVHVLAPAGAQLGPEPGQMTPFHPVALGPGGDVSVGLTVHVICDSTIRDDARSMANAHQADTSFLDQDTSPVVVRYRVLGVTMSQTLSLDHPILVMQYYRSCR
jgi:hypothetical protein